MSQDGPHLSANAEVPDQGVTMVSTRLFAGACLLASLAVSIQPAVADTYQVILRGSVVMKDGTPPPKSVGIQRICSDQYGDVPGPVTDKKTGTFIWRMDVDNTRTRVCRLEATMAGYVSTAIDISDLNGFIDSAKVLPPLVLSLGGADPRTISEKDDDVPAPARAAWKGLVKALKVSDLDTLIVQAKLVTAAAPKFARGWHTLGIAYEVQGKPDLAKNAYDHAVELDPKMVLSWVTLSRIDLLAKDWDGALKAAENVHRLDTKKIYSEVYLHQAVAQYGLGQLDAAEASAKQLLKEDPNERKSRGEFVLGVILAAKHDDAGAKEHIARYLTLNPNPADLDQIKAYAELLGTPQAGTIKPTLEY
jgi:Flp pilus assembly protein TadD